MISLLSEQLIFPDPLQADHTGLLAVGGDLSPERLLLAYANGIFPWYNQDEPIYWYAPRQRCVLFPQQLKVSKSMQKIIKDKTFFITYNTQFEKIITACSHQPRPGQDGTWITEEMQEAYIELHRLGHAQSVEVWHREKLVGGLYGVKMKNIFCGESMFSIYPNASKAALIWLCRSGLFTCIDCQIPTDHLLSMGATVMPSEKYIPLLRQWLSANET